MKNGSTGEAAKLFSRFRKHYKKLYTLCLAITGRGMDAEKALCALMAGGNKYASEKQLRKAATREAMLIASCNEDAGFFDCLRATGDDAVSMRVEAEDELTRRAAFLYYACKLSPARIAQALKVKLPQAVNFLKNIKRAAEETLPGKGEDTLKAMCKEEYARSSYAPDEAGFLRIFEKYLSEMETEGTVSHKGKKIFSGVVSVILLVIIAIMLWVGAVMLDYFRTATVNEKQAASEEVNGGI